MTTATRRKQYIAILWAALSAALWLPALPKATAGMDHRFSEAEKALSNQKTDEGLAILRTLAVDPKTARADRVKAFERIVQTQHNHKDLDAAIATTREMAAAFKDDDEQLQQVYFMQANLLSLAHKNDLAVEAFHQVAAHSQQNKENAIVARLHAARLLQEADRYPQLYEEGAQLVSLLEEDRRMADGSGLWPKPAATPASTKNHLP